MLQNMFKMFIYVHCFQTPHPQTSCPRVPGLFPPCRLIPLRVRALSPLPCLAEGAIWGGEGDLACYAKMFSVSKSLPLGPSFLLNLQQNYSVVFRNLKVEEHSIFKNAGKRRDLKDPLSGLKQF